MGIRKILYCLLAFLSGSNLWGQKKTPLDSLITVTFVNESLNACIHKLENQTHFFFSFNEAELMEEHKTVNGSFNVRTTASILDVIFKNTKINYKYLGGQVVLFKKKKKVTISGYIKDAQSGEVLIGASIYAKDPFLGTASNAYGFYSLSLPEDRYELFAAFISKELKMGYVDLRKDTTINVLLPTEINLDEVEIKTNDVNGKVSEVKTADKLNLETVKKIPAPFGEPDILRVIQMLPGVQTTGDASLGYYVRGGSFSQNLVLLDDAPVYNPTHLFGIISAFNTDMVKSVDFYKGGVPAGYQAGASSVLDLRAKDGNDKTFHVGGGAGLISSRLYFEGPIKKEKGSFFLAGRKSLLTDYILKSGFYDVNLKMNYMLNEKNRIFFSGYNGKDYFNHDSSTAGWTNQTFTLRHNHIYNGKFFSNTSLIYSKFSTGSTLLSNGGNLSFTSNQFVGSRIAKFVLSYFPKTGTSFNAGVYFNNQLYSPFSMRVKYQGLDTTVNLTLERKAIEAAFFIEGTFNLTKSVIVNLGIRTPVFKDLTNGLLFNDLTTDDPDSIEFKPRTFAAIEPRVSISYLFKPNQSVKANYNHINQFQQQFQGGSFFNPAQLWLPSSSFLNPQIVDQFSLGYFLKLKKTLFSVETFYKQIRHVSDFVGGSQLSDDGFIPSTLLNIESLLKEGVANSYGVELSVNKSQGRFTGWFNYTLANTIYSIVAINNGIPYPSNFDSRHTVSLGGMIELNKKWEFASTFNFRTGRPFTLPDVNYEVNGQFYKTTSERNKERTPTYHRMDISFIYKTYSNNKRFSSTWIFSLMNIYNKFNPTYYETNGQAVVGYAIFPIFPSVSYNFRF